MGSKAGASVGGISLSAALVAVGLWAAGVNPPQEIVLSLQAIVSAVVTYAAVYFTPHA